MMIYHSNLIQDVKERINIEEVIERYTNVTIKRHFCICPFHNEKTASMSISATKQIFKCFGCGISGDVITFVSKLFNINAREAAQKINEDFGLGLDFNKKVEKKEIMEFEIKKRIKEEFNAWCEHTTRILSNYHCYLYKLPWDNEERCLKIDIVDYLSNIMIYGNEQEKVEVYKKYKNFIEEVNKNDRRKSR